MFAVPLVPVERLGDFPGGSAVKNTPARREARVLSLCWGDPLEGGRATSCSILAGRIPWTEDPAGLQSMGPHKVRHDCNG